MAANRKGTVVRNKKDTMTAYNVSPGNFWEIGNYGRAVKRINESNTFCDDLVKMFTERADIEAKYSKRLTEWHERWSKALEVSPLYATMKTASLGTLKEAQDRAIIHMDCWGKIHNQVIECIKRHKESHYHKAFVGIKEAKDYDEEFAKAQKPWASAYGKVQRAKKNYHSACRQRQTASQNLSVATKDSEMPPEKVKKLEDALHKCERSASTMQKKYEEKLSRIEPLNKTYEDETRGVYNKWAKDEEQRKDFLQRVLVDFHKSVNITEDRRLKECFDNQLNVAYTGKPQYDVTWWSENYGADMPRNWPKFEELGDVPDMPQSVSVVEPPEPQNNYHSQMTHQQPHQIAEQETAVNSYTPVVHPKFNPFINDMDDDDDWDEPPPPPMLQNGGIPVRALYDYSKVEDDELSFQAGDVLTKLSGEDEQGWCSGMINNVKGLFPANYVEPI